MIRPGGGGGGELLPKVDYGNIIFLKHSQMDGSVVLWEVFDVPSRFLQLKFVQAWVNETFPTQQGNKRRRSVGLTLWMQKLHLRSMDAACNSIFPAQVPSLSIEKQYSSKLTSSSTKGAKSASCSWKKKKEIKYSYSAYHLVSYLRW